MLLTQYHFTLRNRGRPQDGMVSHRYSLRAARRECAVCVACVSVYVSVCVG